VRIRNVARHLEKKLKDWLDSVAILEAKAGRFNALEDNYVQLRDRLINKVMISGGALTSLLRDEEPNDYDIYVNDMELAKELAQLYLDVYVKKQNHGVEVQVRPDGTGVKYFFDPLQRPFSHLTQLKKSKRKYAPFHVTENAITLTEDVQVILRFVGTPEEVHRNFDFVHCTNYYTLKDGVCLNLPAMTSVMTKELRYNGSLYPVAAYFRLRKFLERGWYINAAEMFKIAFDINALDLQDQKVLAAQLIGVDELYFNNVITKLFEKNQETFERSTLFQILDLAFDNDEKDRAVGESSSW
jgi:hypothetical protein